MTYSFKQICAAFFAGVLLLRSAPIGLQAEITGNIAPACLLQPPIIQSVSCLANGQLAVLATCDGAKTGYTLIYRQGTSNVWNRQNIDCPSDSVLFQLKNLAKKNYYVSLRSYLTTGGKTYYSDWSPTVSCKASAESNTVPSVKKAKSFKVTCSKDGQLRVTITAQSKVSGFTIAYKLYGKSSWKKKNISVDTRKLSYTLKNLKKKYYQVNVRTYKTYKGTNYYSDWCSTKTIKAKKKG